MKVKSITISSQSLFPDYVTLKHPLLIYKLHSRHADKPEKVSNEKVKENSKESGGWLGSETIEHCLLRVQSELIKKLKVCLEVKNRLK